MDIRAAEISAILKNEIASFGIRTEEFNQPHPPRFRQQAFSVLQEPDGFDDRHRGAGSRLSLYADCV